MSNLTQTLRETLQKNGNLLTIFAVSLIVFTGVSLADNPQHWWYSLVSVGTIFIVVFLFLNAKVFIKSTVSLFTVFLLGAFAFKLGTELEYADITTTSTQGGSVWMMSMFFVYFLNLTLSFVKPSGQSRWGVSTVATILGFISTFFFSGAGINVSIAALMGGIVSIALFALWYWFGKNSRFSPTVMPSVGMSEVYVDSLYNQALESGYGAWKRSYRGRNSLIFWNSEKAYHIINVDLEQKFANMGKKTIQLSYKGKNINPWLTHLIFTLTPFKGTHNADIMTVLLDINDTNGSEPKVIGVEIPDSNKKIPVGIMPVKKFMKKDTQSGIFNKIQTEFNDFVQTLTPKQVHALDMKLKEELPTEEDTTNA